MSRRLRKIKCLKTQIVEAFGYTDQSVNDMIQKLKAKSLVKFIPYRGVHLTEKGMKEAKRLIRNHRIWEVFYRLN